MASLIGQVLSLGLKTPPHTSLPRLMRARMIDEPLKPSPTVLTVTACCAEKHTPLMDSHSQLLSYPSLLAIAGERASVPTTVMYPLPAN